MPRYKVFLVYISNVCDDLPAKDVARSGGRVYRVESRALPQADAERIATGISAEPAALTALIEKLLRLGPAAADGRAGGRHRVPDTPKGRLLDGAAPSMCAGALAQAGGGTSTESITNTVAFAVGMLPQSTMFPLTSGASGVPVISTMPPCTLGTEPAPTRPWAS